MTPVASKIVDRCVDCGFCEVNCPSRDITLTPRQRIAVLREVRRLEGSREAGDTPRLEEMRRLFEYQGNATCAADGMCQEKCPVKINTGDLVKSLRREEYAGTRAGSLAVAFANNFGRATALVPSFLDLVSFFHGVVGAAPLIYSADLLNRWTGNLVPTWTPHMPKGAPPIKAPPAAVAPTAAPAPSGIECKAVYLPSCVSRMMGPSRGDEASGHVSERLMSLASKAGYSLVIPDGLSDLCCGMMFDSRGFGEAADVKAKQLEAALLRASENGKLPIVCDTSPCLKTMKEAFTSPALRLGVLYEPAEFTAKFLVDKLDFAPSKHSVSVHVPCSSKKLGLEATFVKLAGLCADKVTAEC